MSRDVSVCRSDRACIVTEGMLRDRRTLLGRRWWTLQWMVVGLDVVSVFLRAISWRRALRDGEVLYQPFRWGYRYFRHSRCCLQGAIVTDLLFFLPLLLHLLRSHHILSCQLLRVLILLRPGPHGSMSDAVDIGASLQVIGYAHAGFGSNSSAK